LNKKRKTGFSMSYNYPVKEAGGWGCGLRGETVRETQNLNM
jgi:hypothetical protein